MLKGLIIGAGAFLGAIARYGLSGWIQRRQGGTFPWGTMAVNVIGCLALGIFMTLVEDRQLFGPQARLFVTVGLLGSFTTFSTFGYETFELLREHEEWLALTNTLGNAMLGVVAVWLGRALVRLF